MLYDVAAKSEKELLSIEPMEKAAVRPPDAEQFDWQNRRVIENSFQWSPSGKELLLSVEGDLFLYPLDSGKWDATHRYAGGRARSEAFARRVQRGLPSRSRSLHARHRLAQT